MASELSPSPAPRTYSGLTPTQPRTYLCSRDSLRQGGEWGQCTCSYTVRADRRLRTQWWRESRVPRVVAENTAYTQAALDNSPMPLHSRWGATITQGQHLSALHTTGSPFWRRSTEMVRQPGFKPCRRCAPFLAHSSCGCLPARSAVFSLLFLFVQPDQFQGLGVLSTLTSPTLLHRCVLPL